MGTRRQWARDFAAALGNASPTASTLSWISAWTANENTEAKYNPLATTYDLPPNTNFNSVGVKNFTTRAQGIEATVRTLRGQYPGYADIVKGVVQNDPQTAANGLLVAPWGSNGATVMAQWKMGDVGDQNLRSEPSTEKATPSEGNVPLHTPERIPPGGEKTVGTEFGSKQTIDTPYGVSSTKEDVPLSGGLRTAYVIGGAFLVIIAGFLAIKTYIPTSQIVKTVAEVAV